MKSVSLSDERVELVRRRALEGVADVLGRGEDLTYANVAAAGGVAERTLYRHFPTREVLLAAVFDWANERIGFRGEYPTDAAQLAELARRVFPGFDSLAPVIRELLIAPEGRTARLASKPERQRSALALARNEAADLDRVDERRLAAILQLLTAASTWQTLRDYWDMDGSEAAETVALAIELILEGARARAKRQQPAKKSATARTTRKVSP